MTTNQQHSPKILVLLDMGKSSLAVLQAAKSLSERVHGSLKVLHVKEPAKVVKQANQFSAKKELYQDYQGTQKEVKALAEKVSKNINYDLIYGNVKLSVLESIADYQPDIVILGRRAKNFDLAPGDKLIDVLIDAKAASLLIVGEKDNSNDFTEFSAGILSEGKTIELGEWQSFLEQGSKKVRYFSVDSKKTNLEGVMPEGDQLVFSGNANPVQSLVSYTDKTNTGLFFIPKGVNKKFSKKLAKKMKTSVLVVN